MTGLRGLAVLAILAALLGAPSRAFAAGNELSFPVASPATGSTDTVFSFSVRYDGAFAAQAVTAELAGLAVPMILAAGTELGGVWTTATVLPAGTWTVSFHAMTGQGNDPILEGPSLTVTGPVEPSADASALPSPDASGNGNGGGGRASPNDGADPPAASQPAPEGHQVSGPSATPPAAAAPVATPAATSVPAPVAPAPDSAQGAGAVPAPEAVPQPASAATADPAADQTRDAEQSLTGVAVGSPGGDVANGTLRDDAGEAGDLVEVVLMVGGIGLGAVALTGTALILAARRRSRDKQETATAMAEAAAALERRTLRRSKIRIGGDPIIEALGIEDERPRPTTKRRRKTTRRAGKANEAARD